MSTASILTSVGITKDSELNLNRLVNLALSSSPKVGIVNFNLLKTFLIELLKALNLQHYEPKFGDDTETNNLVLDAIENEGQHDKILNLINNGNEDTSHQASNQNLSKQGISILTSDMKPLTLERFHVLEDKLARFEQQMSALNSLPSNQDIINKSKDLKKSSNAAGPILEIWQYTQLSKRLESNEEGITKLTSLLQDLINEMNDLKDSQNKNSDDINKLNDTYKDLLNRINSFDKLFKSLPSLDQMTSLQSEIDALKKMLNNMDKFDSRLNQLANQIKAIEAKIMNMVNHPDLELYVQWPALESSLRGLKDAFDTAMNKEPVLNEQRFTQTTPLVPETREPSPVPQAPVKNVVVPPVQVKETEVMQPPVLIQPVQVDTVKLTDPAFIRDKKPTSAVSRPVSSHPSKDLQDILSKLGTLNQRHEKLKELVEQLKLELAKKQQQQQAPAPLPPTPRAQSPQFKLPSDFAEKMEEIKKIKNALEELKNNLTSETNKRMQLENMLANLNNELDNIRNSLKECLRNTQLNRDDIIGLKEAIRMLEETKADKDWIKSEFERKADKRDLDQKVNRKTFDETTNELSNSVNNCIQKNISLEDDWKKGNENIFKELEQKLDRLELDSLKEYIEKQLKKLRKLQKENAQPVQTMPAINPEDEAAGLRKQLLRFHCISCDRPIDMPHQQMPLPSLPAEKGMRPIQTPRPYTTFELDQIRQFQKQQFLQEQGYDLFSTVRQCGGPHTLTIPHKKLLKIPNPVAEESNTPVPPAAAVPATTHRNEVHLQGQDGHIYKGRIEARLSVDMKKSVKNSNQSNNIRSNHSNSNNNNNQLSSSYTNIRTVNEDKDGQEDQSFDKSPVFTN